MGENIALVDMDGTVCKYHEALERDLQAFFGKDRSKVSEMTVAKAGFLIRSQAGWYRELEPIPFGLKIVDHLKKMGFTIMVLTKGNRWARNAWTEKVEWCKKHLPGAKITITEDKGLVYGKVLVDDWPDYAKRWLEHRPRGIVVMPAKKWNASFSTTKLPIFKVRGEADFKRVAPLLKARAQEK